MSCWFLYSNVQIIVDMTKTSSLLASWSFSMLQNFAICVIHAIIILLWPHDHYCDHNELSPFSPLVKNFYRSWSQKWRDTPSYFSKSCRLVQILIERLNYFWSFFQDASCITDWELLIYLNYFEIIICTRDAKNSVYIMSFHHSSIE